jgi:hypothetical protein
MSPAHCPDCSLFLCDGGCALILSRAAPTLAQGDGEGDDALRSLPASVFTPVHEATNA